MPQSAAMGTQSGFCSFVLTAIYFEQYTDNNHTPALSDIFDTNITSC